MRAALTVNTPTTIELAPVYGRDYKTLTVENRGAFPVYLVPAALPTSAAQLYPNYDWDENFTNAKIEFCTDFGYLLGPNQRHTRSVEDKREITTSWSAICLAGNTELFFIVEK